MSDIWQVDPEQTFTDWFEVNDPEGWYHAEVRSDGCVHLDRYFNAPRGAEGGDVDSLHICDIDDMIARLQALKAEALKHFGKDWC